jgi:hypothetical protein
MAPMTRNGGRRNQERDPGTKKQNARIQNAVKEEEMLNLAIDMIGRKTCGAGNIIDRRCREVFGCRAFIASKIWFLISSQPTTHGTVLKHMLWALLFLKVYEKETTLCSWDEGVDETTFRKWIWPVHSISELEPVVVSIVVYSMLAYMYVLCYTCNLIISLLF